MRARPRASRRLRARAAARRRAARSDARAAVASPRFQRLLLAADLLCTTSRFAAPLRASGSDGVAAKAPAERAATFATAMLARRHRKFVRIAAHLLHASNEERHAARIAAKRLRYVAEFFAPLFAGKRSRTYLETLAAMQDALGRINDAVTAVSLAGELAGPADARPARCAAGCGAGGGGRAGARPAWRRFDASRARSGRRVEPRRHGRAASCRPTGARRGSRAATCRPSGRTCCRVPPCPSGASASTRPTATSGTSTGSTADGRAGGRAAGRAVPRARRQLGVALRKGAAGWRSPRAAGAAWCPIFAAAAGSRTGGRAPITPATTRKSHAMLAAVRARVAPETVVYAVGISVGGSVLLNWLGRAGRDAAGVDRRGRGRVHAARSHRRRASRSARD